MVEQLKRDWVAWLLTLGAVITLAGPLGMLRELGQSFGGYITFQRSTSMLPEIDLNTPAWWSGIINNRAGHGDTLVSVNGRPHATEARSAYAEAAQNGQTSAALAVIPDNESETRTVQVPINTFSLGYFFDVRMPDLITGFVLWASALIVYLARPNEPANRTFALAAATVGYTRILYVHTIFFDSAYATMVEIWLSILLAFNGAVTYHFAMSFPQPIQRKAVRFSIILVYLLGVMTAIGLVTSRIPSLSPEYRSTAYWTGYYLSIILLLVGVVALVSRLLWMRFSLSSSKRDRRISSILVMGLLISMPAILVSGFNALDWSPSLPSYFWKGLDLRFLLLAIPLTFAFVFTRYQAMHSPSRVFIILIGLSSSALTAAIGSWLWTLSYPMWQDSGLRPPFMVLFITALATTLFWSIAARWRSMLGRDLNWSGYSNTTLRAFGRRIVTTEENEIPQSIVDALVSEFELDQAAIWVYQPNDSTLRLAAQSGTQQTPLPSLMTITESYPEDQFRPFRANELASVTAEWAQSLVASGGVELYLPLISGGQVQGLLGLGSRWDEDVFDDRDLETAELVSQQAALFLAAARYIRELKRVPGRMADVQDRERLRLARELHDTTQQFLGRLPFLLAISRNSIESNPQKATELLDQSIANVEEAAQEVRQIRHNLAPSQLEHGLTNALITLTTNFQRRTGLTTTLITPPDLDPSTVPETRHAIYRVIQQSLDNIEAHANATTVDVHVAVESGLIRFSITDDGRGSSEEERQLAQSRGSYGIESMTARLVAAGGGLEVHSIPGNGLRIEACIPVVSGDELKTTTSPEIPSADYYLKNIDNASSLTMMSSSAPNTAIGDNP